MVMDCAGAFEAVEIPVGDAVDGGDQGGVGGHHGGDGGGGGGEGVGFEGDDDVVLDSRLGSGGDAARVDGDGLAVAVQGDATGLHGGEVGAAGDEGDIGTGLGEADTDHAADGAGAEDCDFHARRSWPGGGGPPCAGGRDFSRAAGIVLIVEHFSRREAGRVKRVFADGVGGRGCR